MYVCMYHIYIYIHIHIAHSISSTPYSPYSHAQQGALHGAELEYAALLPLLSFVFPAERLQRAQVSASSRVLRQIQLYWLYYTHLQRGGQSSASSRARVAHVILVARIAVLALFTTRISSALYWFTLFT